MTSSSSPRPARAPARAWLRPALLALGGLAVAALLLVADQLAGAVLVALVAVLMGYWTSPLRGGQHVPLAPALERRGPDHAIILWAPGDPLSARLQTAIRGERPDVTWVNVYRDAAAAELLAREGGRAALPLVFVGEATLRRATVGQYLDARAEAEEPATTTETD